jgi:hypothetical protein
MHRESNQGAWMLYFAVAILSLPFWYVVSSGPMKIGLDQLEKPAETHEQFYAPLVWLRDNTPARAALGWYWGNFQTAAERQETEGLDKWLYSPKARMIRRNLGTAD